MQILAQQRKERETKRNNMSEDERTRMDRVKKSLEQTAKNISSQGPEWAKQNFVNLDGETIPALVIRVFPDMEKTKSGLAMWSRSFEVLINNVNIPYLIEKGVVQNDALQLNVLPPIAPDKNKVADMNLALQLTDPTLPWPKIKEIHSGTLHVVSVKKILATGISPGQLVILRGVRAQAGQIKDAGKNPTRDVLCALAENANVYLNIGYPEVLGDATSRNMYGYVISQKWQTCWFDKKADISTEWDSRSIDFIRIDHPIDTAVYNIPEDSKYVSLVKPIYDKESESWTYADKITGNAKMVAQLRFTIQQWLRSDGPEKPDRVIVKCTAYEESLRLFHITDPGKWKQLAYYIFEKLSFFLAGTTNADRTKSYFTLTNCGDAPDSDIGRYMDVSFIYADVAFRYKEIGIPVSRKWVAEQYHVTGYDKVMATSVFGVNTVICMDEYKGQKEQVLAENDVCFRVVGNFRVSEELAKIFEKMTPEEGATLVDVLVLSESDTAPPLETLPKIVKRAKKQINADELVFCTFAIVEPKIPYENAVHAIESHLRPESTQAALPAPDEQKLLLAPEDDPSPYEPRVHELVGNQEQALELEMLAEEAQSLKENSKRSAEKEGSKLGKSRRTEKPKDPTTGGSKSHAKDDRNLSRKSRRSE